MERIQVCLTWGTLRSYTDHCHCSIAAIRPTLLSICWRSSQRAFIIPNTLDHYKKVPPFPSARKYRCWLAVSQSQVHFSIRLLIINAVFVISQPDEAWPLFWTPLWRLRALIRLFQVWAFLSRAFVMAQSPEQAFSYTGCSLKENSTGVLPGKVTGVCNWISSDFVLGHTAKLGKPCLLFFSWKSSGEGRWRR